MKRYPAAAILFVILLGPVDLAFAQNGNRAVPPEVRSIADKIEAARLKKNLEFVTTGNRDRSTPSAGLDAVSKFIATTLSRLKVKPMGDGGDYFQTYKIRRTRLDTNKSFAESSYRKYSIGNDYLQRPDNPSGTISGKLVYVGHGVVHKAKNLDPYRHVDVKDKIVIFSYADGSGIPKGMTRADFTGKRGEDYEIPIEAAQKRGAKAIIRIPHLGILRMWRARREGISEGTIGLDGAEPQAATPLPEFALSLHMLDDIFEGEAVAYPEVFRRAIDSDPAESFELGPEKQLTFTTAGISETLASQNVIGMIEGSDPVLKNEFVTFMAHYDAIATGADDNGSGTVGLLEIAEAFARAPRPKRSVLFLWDSGEESGLLGTRHFIRNPPVPFEKIVTHFNIDMIGRSKGPSDTDPASKELAGPNQVYLTGPKALSTELLGLLTSVNRSYLNLDYSDLYDTTAHEFFYPRADHAPFLQNGVLIASYATGIHQDYHRKSDTPDKIDYPKLEKIARTIFVSAWTLANEPKRPVIDKPIPSTITNRR